MLGTAREEAAGTGGNLAAPLLADELGGGAGTVGGDLFLAVIAAVAFATILVSPGVWPGPDAEGSPIGWELANPGIVSIPLGFLGCWLGTVLSGEEAKATPRRRRFTGDALARRFS